MTIDKIRTEIERLHYYPKLDFIKNDEVVDMVLEIIDKYTKQEPTTLQQIIKKHNMAKLAYDEMSDFERDVLKYAEQEPCEEISPCEDETKECIRNCFECKYSSFYKGADTKGGE